MAARLSPHLMFEGNAGDALELYLAAFPDAEETTVDRYGEDEQGKAGTIKLAELHLAGTHVLLIDSPIPHNFTFTPSVSLFVDCSDEEELERVFATLSEGGAVLMPLGDYGFSERFAWITDRFGVSWQLNLP
jgi:predicted 3-demethylubiquinone-9 3-methyltransferase (glyoxalase superfamily)